MRSASEEGVVKRVRVIYVSEGSFCLLAEIRKNENLNSLSFSSTSWEG